MSLFKLMDRWGKWNNKRPFISKEGWQYLPGEGHGRRIPAAKNFKTRHIWLIPDSPECRIAAANSKMHDRSGLFPVAHRSDTNPLNRIPTTAWTLT